MFSMLSFGPEDGVAVELICWDPLELEPCVLLVPGFRTKLTRSTNASTADIQRWEAAYDGVKMGERVVGYPAEE